MRLLYLPMWSSNKNLQTCSTYNWAKNFFRNVIDNDDFYLYFCVPEDTEEDFSEVSGKNVKLIPIKSSMWQYEEMYYLDDRIIDLFKQSTGKYVIDAVISDKTLCSNYLMSNINDTYNKAHKILNILTSKFTLLREAKTKESLQKHLFFSQMENFAMCDLLMLVSEFQKGRILDTCRRYYSATIISELEKKMFVRMSTNNIETLESICLEKPTDKILFNYSNAIHSGYKAEKIFEEFNMLFKLSKPVEIVITTPSVKGGRVFAQKLQHYKHFEFHMGLNQDDFWKVAGRCHVGMHMSKGGELNNSVIEQMMLRQVIVFLDSKMARSHVYKGYPFLAKNHTEIQVMLRDVIENYWTDRIQDVIDKQKKYVIDNFDGIKNSQRAISVIYDMYLNMYAEFCNNPSRQLINWMEDRFKDIDEISWDEFKRIVKSETSGKINMDKAHGQIRLTKNQMYLLMQSIGFKDTNDSEMPNFRR